MPSLFELARVAEGMDSHFCDIRDPVALAKIVATARPEIVFHLAAQPLVRTSYRTPLETFSSNVMGTAHLMDALRGLSSVRVAVIITTDKVYQNKEWSYPYREDDRLGGHDPYSASKAASEIVISSYRDAFLAKQGVAVASARAGNVVAGGDWSEDRLVPDAIRAWQSGRPLKIRRPGAIRPWQHVLEPLAGYLRLAQRLWEQPDLSGSYNFGPQTNEIATVRQIVEMARVAYGDGEAVYSDDAEGPHEAGWLAREISKARMYLDVTPKWPVEVAVNRTIAWYRAQHAGSDARSLCDAEISAYEAVLS